MGRIVYRKTLAFNRLFYRTCSITKYSPMQASVLNKIATPPGKFGRHYKLGKFSFGGFATYQLHVKNFLKFVEDLEKLNVQRSKILEGRYRKIPNRTQSEGGANIMRLLMDAFYREESKTKKETYAFLTKYKDALEALTFSHFCCEHMPGVHLPTEFLNMQLFPRAAKEQQLFMRFIRAYLELHAERRLKIQGPKHGTQSIPPDLLRMAEGMRHKGQSLDMINKKVSEASGCEIKFTDSLKQVDKKAARIEATRRTLARHFVRIKQSRPK